MKKIINIKSLAVKSNDTLFNSFHGDIQNVVQEANVRYDSHTAWINAKLRGIAEKYKGQSFTDKTGKLRKVDLKFVCEMVNDSGLLYPVSYDAVKQFKYDKAKKVASPKSGKTVKRTKYAILFDMVKKYKNDLTVKQIDSIVVFLKRK